MVANAGHIKSGELPSYTPNIMFKFLLPVLCIFLYPMQVSAQQGSAPSVMKLFSARQYDDYQGDARITQVRLLQKNDWQARDSFYDLPDQYGKSQLRISRNDLAPYVNEDGYIVYLVPEVAPQFPGGEAALQLYKQDVLGPDLAGPNDEVQRSVYIRCIIATDGRVTDVEEAQPHYNLVSEAFLNRCLDAVRYMPVWSPGLFNGKPVPVCQLVEFSLR